MRNWEKNIRKTVPYVPGEQPRGEHIIKLNTNENPYPPAPGVEKALKEISAKRLRLYPDPACSVLVEAIAQTYGVGTDQVFTGVGSDDVLAMCFMTFFNDTKPVLFPDITYSFYEVWADMLRIPYEKIPLDEQFSIRREDYRRANGGIIFPNPNAPTGVELPLADIEDILRNNPDVIVIVDEAYVDFGAESALKLLNRFENLIVVQTFSKSRSMAGMRIGYAIASPVLIKYLNDVKYSFNSYTMNETSLAAGRAALLDQAYFKEVLAKIIATRERTKKKLKEMGFSFPDSRSNFVFARHETCPAEKLFEGLKEAGIYVRYFNSPRISEYLRITIGTDSEMDEFFAVLKPLVQRLKQKEA
ncbi:Histidinol-phosphate aminotransferase [uncultured Roseburia sp.]|uniref:Histidinol-phosphate aminotransferase n=1 Tax=Brotonthovivens ammoniilytica TaxID=2981725 RepID=A0ABT2TLN7_9FIRM|nr:histidinol-phosphate transaminase [Brotonthovivens ammoniilytica]MCU6763108.1 histidinol-phosphate transaminase [Brotonthovivens ammoniilytica]SCJ03445.1 Histidinol-phosphate aminotransferase [uncultured Roseburia sp.]